MKKALIILLIAPLAVAQVDPSLHSADVINKSQFPVHVKIYKPGAKKDEKPSPTSGWPNEWNLNPGVAKYDQTIGRKDRYTYTKLDLEYSVNPYTFAGRDVKIKHTYDIPKKLQKTNDLIATIDIQKKSGKEATDYLDKVIKDQYPSAIKSENMYLIHQKNQGWAWVPVVTITAK
jgi:hypothetical protein